MKRPPPKEPIRASTTSGLDYGQVIELFRFAPPQAAEEAMDQALDRGGLTDTAKAAEAIARHSALYRERRNPFDALEAFVIARRAGLPIPEWILEYFERAAKRVMLRARGDRENRPREIAEAFDLAPARTGRQGRRPDAMEQLDHDHRAAMMVEAVAEARKRLSREKAVGLVAQCFNSSAAVVRRALKLHGR